MALTVDTVVDETFFLFRKLRNAVYLGKHELGQHKGEYHLKLDSLFVPVDSTYSGFLVSRLSMLQEPPIGQFGDSVVYSNVSGLENITNDESFEQLFTNHLMPPVGNCVRIGKVYGTLYHSGYMNDAEEVTAHQLKAPEYDFEAPFGVIVMSSMGLDPNFSRLKIIKQAEYDEQAPKFCMQLAIADLSDMPMFRLG